MYHPGIIYTSISEASYVHDGVQLQHIVRAAIHRAMSIHSRMHRSCMDPVPDGIEPVPAASGQHPFCGVIDRSRQTTVMRKCELKALSSLLEGISR